jgi:hypothetical protein
MTDPAFFLRAGDAGPEVKGTPGNVLTFTADGKVRGEPAGGGAAPVASFFGADVADVTAEPELNGVFYTAETAGWFRLSWVVATVADFVPGVDSAQLNAYVGAPSQDAVQLQPSLKLYQGGEGTQAFTDCTPADVYLRAGDALHLEGVAGVHVTVGVRLERIV